jgi:ribonuclease BN (tRNA processing enzyme)
VHLTILGSGTVAPSATRTAPAHWVAAGTVRVLFDCGSGVLHRAARCGVPWHQVTHVAITHFHQDHWGELPFLLFALRHGIEPARAAPLRLIGPPGFQTRLTLLAGAYGDWVLHPGYPVEVIELNAGDELPLAEGIQLESHPTPHTAESRAYALRAGGERLVYTGDTGFSEPLGRWAAGCDLLLVECSLPDDRAMDIHLTPAQVAALIRIARPRRTVLTHFYPPVEASAPAEQVARASGLPVVAARDGDRFSIEA